MEQELTNEEISRAFAMYWNTCNVIVYSKEGTKYKYENDASTMAAVKQGAKYKLLLTPLSKITDEHAIEVAKIIGAFDRGADVDKVIAAKNMLRGRFSDQDGLRESIYTHYFSIQYLIQQGYAVPLFFGINHPCNGKTAIELGIAIDKTTVAEINKL